MLLLLLQLLWRLLLGLPLSRMLWMQLRKPLRLLRILLMLRGVLLLWICMLLWGERTMVLLRIWKRLLRLLRACQHRGLLQLRTINWRREVEARCAWFSREAASAVSMAPASRKEVAFRRRDSGHTCLQPHVFLVICCGFQLLAPFPELPPWQTRRRFQVSEARAIHVALRSAAAGIILGGL